MVKLYDLSLSQNLVSFKPALGKGGQIPSAPFKYRAGVSKFDILKPLRGIIWAVILPGFLFAACSIEAALEEVWGASTEAPVFLTCRAVSSREINFEFSLPVKVVSLNFEPEVEVESITEGALVRVTLTESLGVGERFLADLLVEDEEENTLNVMIPFRTRNDRLPSFLITELRTEYSKPKVEFVELKIQSDGNLGALRLFIAGNGLDQPTFEFPPVEVKAEEYLVIHLRTIETGCVNEIGDDLSLSGGTDALPEARDFWVPDGVKRLRKTDAVYFLDQDDRIIDGVLLSENPDNWWTKPAFVEAATLLGGQGAWLPAEGAPEDPDYAPGPSDAVITKNIGSAATRSISRNENISDRNHAGDWYITATSSATPGKSNSDKQFEPK
jgi:hypothetical protein